MGYGESLNIFDIASVRSDMGSHIETTSRERMAKRYNTEGKLIYSADDKKKFEGDVSGLLLEQS